MSNDRPDDREDEYEEGPRAERQNGVPPSGTQAGGGPSPADRANAGGSSGTGGYGRAQNQELAGQTEAASDDLAQDQAEHQDRGQSLVDEE